MTQQNAIKLFEQKQVRSVWDDTTEEWYFSVVDVVAILTDSVNPTDYIKKMRQRDPELSKGWGQIVTPLAVQTAGGKQKMNCASAQGIFRIIQSIPSPKAEPFKLWIAQVAAERLNQMQDPERSIEQAMLDYRRLGYSENWINQRLKSIEIRKELTDEWKRLGLEEGTEFAILTDIIYKAWAGKSAKEYKQFKGLKKENLRDNMTNRELVLNMLAEVSTKDISEAENPDTFAQHAQVAKRGGNVAKTAREQLEKELGHSVISPENAKKLAEVLKKLAERYPNNDELHATPEELKNMLLIANIGEHHSDMSPNGVNIYSPEYGAWGEEERKLKQINRLNTKKQKIEELFEFLKENKLKITNEIKEELEKINKVLGKLINNAPHETLLVIDATTGQNGISQAKSFKEITNITGIVLTKLDGTAKGGIVLAIKELVDIPVKFVGLGEKAEDLIVFDIEKYIYGLFKEF